MEKTARGMVEQIEGSRYFQAAILIALVCVTVASGLSSPGLTALLIAGGIAAAFIWDRADLGVWAIVALTPLETFLGVNFVVTKAVKLGLVAFVACSLLARRSVQPSQGKNELKDPYRVPLYLLLATGFCATLLASSPIRSAIGLATLCLFVIYFISLQKCNLLMRLGPRLLRTVIIVAIPTVVLALFQTTQGYGGILGSQEQRAGEDELYTFWPGIERGSGTFNNPGAAGSFLEIAALVSVMHFLILKNNRREYQLLAMLFFLGILATFSRGPIVGFLAGLIFALWRLKKLDSPRRIILAVFFVSVGLSALFLFEDVRGYLRFGADLVSTSPSRLDAWKATLTIVGRHPFGGIGFYEFQTASQGIEGVSDTPLHPHNGFLKAVVEQGLVGGCAYLLFLVAFIKTAIKSFKVKAVSPENSWILASIGSIGVALFAEELFNAGFTIGGSSIAILFATFLGLQICLLRQWERSSTSLNFAIVACPNDVPKV